jgi:hypothetical protein
MIIPASELPIERYHACAPRWWSKTSLRRFKDEGAPWTGMWLRGEVEPSTPDGVEQGLAIDCLLTEGAESFARRFPRLPRNAPKKPTKAQREAKKPAPESVEAIRWWDEWNAANASSIILSHDDHVICAEAADAIRALPCWSEIEASQAQATVRRDSPGLGIGLQARPDWLHAGNGRLRDLKKTRSLAMFGKQAIDLGYHFQASIAGWCLAGDGIGIEQASLVAVEWKRGARAREYIIPHEALAEGDKQMREIAAEVADRYARGDWSDRQEQPEVLPIPEYMLRRMGVA